MSISFDKLEKVVSALRDPKTGCPWDIEQTHHSIRKYFIEETYEAVEAIDNADDKELCAELGDVLLQIMLHSQIAAERESFTIEDVIQGITEKMIRRHPHVFGDLEVKDSAEVKKNWEEIKKQEKRSDSAYSALLSDIPKSLPALNKAGRIGEKAAQSGFDWSSSRGVWNKVVEEYGELLELLEASDFEPEAKNLERINEELGDLLFSLAQLGRWLKISPEDSLRGCCQKFLARFSLMEQNLEQDISKYSAKELEIAWQQAKTQCREIKP